jgi:hypothetical protein
MTRRHELVALLAAVFALAGCGSTATSQSESGAGPGGGNSSATPTTSASNPTTSLTSASTGSASGAGSCKFLDAATVQQDLGITIAITTQIQNGCLFESATGSHDAPNAVTALHGHDGVILGISAGSLQTSSRCQQTSIPGVPAPGAVCQQTVATGGVTIAAFKLSGNAVGSLTIYAPGTPALSGVDQLAAAAYPRMLAG